MIEIRKIESDMVRNLCIKENYYTGGDNEEYKNLLNNLCNRSINITVNELEVIADDILQHSNTQKKQEAYGCTYAELKQNLMYCLAKDCCNSFFE